MKTHTRPSPNRYHAAAAVYLAVAAAAGIFLGGFGSPSLVAKGWHIFHAYIAFMGFGTLIILGQQKELLSMLLGREPFNGGQLFLWINGLLWIIWISYLAQGLTGNDSFYYFGLAAGAGMLVCLAVFSAGLYGGTTPGRLWSVIPLRFRLPRCSCVSLRTAR